MLGNRNERHHWGVILAGGDGTRLKLLTHSVSNDDRPKQFSPLLNGKTLLAQTRLRIERRVDPHRTLFVLNKAHESFYRDTLARVSPIQKVIQPSNRGTLPAILWSLLRIIRLDEDAVVAFFPSDHYYFQEEKFMAGVASGFALAELHPDKVILLGAAANRPETEYGWIEPEATLGSPVASKLSPVKRFWEKPSDPVAQTLLDRGCLWNTFVMVGRVSAFLSTIQQAVPLIYRTFESILLTPVALELEADLMRPIYDQLPVADFSKLVLSASTERLCVTSLGDIGWSDLGDPQRLITTLFAAGMTNQWVTAGSCNCCGIKLASPATTLVSANSHA
jgi:mannose-1-phosphate guanylyltransferase